MSCQRRLSLGVLIAFASVCCRHNKPACSHDRQSKVYITCNPNPDFSLETNKQRNASTNRIYTQPPTPTQRNTNPSVVYTQRATLYYLPKTDTMTSTGNVGQSLTPRTSVSASRKSKLSTGRNAIKFNDSQAHDNHRNRCSARDCPAHGRLRTKARRVESQKLL